MGAQVAKRANRVRPRAAEGTPERPDELHVGYDEQGVWHERSFEGWRLATRLQWQGGRLVVTELRVIPDPYTSVPTRGRAQVKAERDQRNDHSGWGTWSESPDDAPDGGITTPLLRRLPLAAATQSVREHAALHAEALASIGYVPEAWASYVAETTTNRRPGRSGRSDLFYAQVAAAYVERLALGSRRPIAEMARDMHYERASIETQLREARRRELLTYPDVRGRAGGELTDKARALLSASGTDEGGRS